MKSIRHIAFIYTTNVFFCLRLYEAWLLCWLFGWFWCWQLDWFVSWFVSWLSEKRTLRLLAYKFQISIQQTPNNSIQLSPKSANNQLNQFVNLKQPDFTSRYWLFSFIQLIFCLLEMLFVISTNLTEWLIFMVF